MENKFKEGILLIKEWIKLKSQELEENENFIELIRVLNEIIKEKDLSENAYEDIRYLLRPFEYIPLSIKRIFNIGMMDLYTIFIASRHFNSINDFINLELCTRRFNGNMTKFHYNPISLSQSLLHFFPNVQTLHLYQKDDTFLEGGRIIKYVDWRRLGYYDYYIKKSIENDKEIEFKAVVFTKDDCHDEMTKQNPYKKYDFRYHFKIPDGVIGT